MKETDHQTQIKLSVRRQGGYSFKLSNRFTIGIPDLLIALYPFVPLLAEVKDLGKCMEDFDRQLNVSPKQAHELKSINAVYKEYPYPCPVGILLVTLEWEPTGRILVGLPGDTERLSGRLLRTTPHFVCRQSGMDKMPPWYDMRTLMNSLEVPHVGYA